MNGAPGEAGSGAPLTSWRKGQVMGGIERLFNTRFGDEDDDSDLQDDGGAGGCGDGDGCGRQ
ncbi:hypothetical protein I3J09_10060 [Streptomyces clavuligerus]|uniref:Uncharacterized protein n=1 Tax=Streptomyces clavuligerus TaxID=1901 RepID=B5H2W6_STRCL|nr:hypothetical protein BB341_09945 [Streptomyces clavuligerus]AXU13090.1 hypothetical protein D1794_10285 [Streptomyces clavuligerus]EDY52912.1 hypothetical protein SSCG_05965 [Streptomyces clavuligerus]EFG08821.1 Hypothetical protein SCLAV_3749 [Streptomyces clavuligerus]MBY6303027.1 hypothetical protein [Streptomyces clavuligerus]